MDSVRGLRGEDVGRSGIIPGTEPRNFPDHIDRLDHVTREPSDQVVASKNPDLRPEDVFLQQRYSRLTRDVDKIPVSGARDAVVEYQASQSARLTRSSEQQQAFRTTARDLGERGIPPHPFELAEQQRPETPRPAPQPQPTTDQVPEPARSADVRYALNAPAGGEDWSRRVAGPDDGERAVSFPPQDSGDDPNAPLSWVSGIAMFGMHTDSPWFQQVSAENGFPVKAGLSGTAARLHSVFAWIRPDGVIEEHFTRALLGWLLSADDHSLYEIVRGIEVASPGLFYDRTDGYTDVADLYRRVSEIVPGYNPAGG